MKLLKDNTFFATLIVVICLVAIYFVVGQFTKPDLTGGDGSLFPSSTNGEEIEISSSMQGIYDIYAVEDSFYGPELLAGTTLTNNTLQKGNLTSYSGNLKFTKVDPNEELTSLSNGIYEVVENFDSGTYVVDVIDDNVDNCSVHLQVTNDIESESKDYYEEDFPITISFGEDYGDIYSECRVDSNNNDEYIFSSTDFFSFTKQ